MGISARFVLAPRGLNGTSTYDPSIAAAAGTSNATLGLIEELVFAESKSVRTSTIILAAFNVLASFTTAASILYDCYWASKRCNPKFKASKFCVSRIHPAETFPLVLSVGILIQGLVFAGVQGTGLKSLHNATGCGTVAQFMWPALFIVPYIQLVFGIECAARSLRSLPFQPRRKYDVTICIGLVFLMLIATWVPSHINPEEEGCFASLVWFISQYGKLGLVLLSLCAGVIALSALTIFVRLSGAMMIDEDQRIAASRMVYYLVLALVSLAFVIPYFVSQTISNGNLKTAMMATVVLNLSGLMTGLLQLFLRSNTSASAFGPKGKWTDRTKHEIKIWGPNELVFGHALRNPIEQPHELRAESRRGLTALSRTESRRSSTSEKGQVISLEPIATADFKPPTSKYNLSGSNAMERAASPEASSSVISPQSHSRKPSYTIFPSNATSPNQSNRPAESIYDISDLGDLPAPPRIHFSGGSRHRRDSSMNTIASSATVQIGLRLSHAPGTSTSDEEPLPLPSTTYSAPYKRAASPVLQIQTQNLAPLIPPPKSPLRPQGTPLAAPVSPESTSPSSLDKAERDARMKTLPPVPRVMAPEIKRLSTSQTVLSPTVYSPETSKKPSPLRNNSVASTTRPQTAQRSPSRSDRSMRSPPPPGRSNSGRVVKKEDVKDWI
ncbi:hypothetical protein BP6252_01213 [Coleophoma cylindrospora]|uniref:Uncharacterized protein n=1 Tax=Coleophoma cylindrospora TaxID=1849047 RepID=A0A3D8SSM9_9HELO|nr:hypothetical protein BP6252_01213 [Coleophoma cylindrospora]